MPFLRTLFRRAVLALTIVLTLLTVSENFAAEQTKVQSLKITVLSTMLAEANSVGEWGFAALVEADGRKLLFDTGSRPDTVLMNAQSLSIDLSVVEDAILSHNHDDHTGGLTQLRSVLLQKNPNALKRTHVAPQIFWPRLQDGREWNSMRQIKQQYESSGGRFELHDSLQEIFPGVWFSGPIPRPHPERNWSPGITLRNEKGVEEEDYLPEDSALIIDTADGLVILTGCGHAGVVNIATYARKIIRPAKILSLMGGFHLFRADDAHLKWTAGQLKSLSVESIIGAHCTGIEAVYQLRTLMGLQRPTAIVSAVGTSYTLGRGIDAGGAGLAK